MVASINKDLYIKKNTHDLSKTIREDQAAQKYKANQKLKLEKRQGTQNDAYVKRTQYQNACAVSTMLGIYPRGICKARRLQQRSEYPCGV